MTDTALPKAFVRHGEGSYRSAVRDTQTLIPPVSSCSLDRNGGSVVKSKRSADNFDITKTMQGVAQATSRLDMAFISTQAWYPAFRHHGVCSALT